MINSGWVAQMRAPLVKMRAPDVATALSWIPRRDTFVPLAFSLQI